MSEKSYIVNQKLVFLSKQTMDFLPSNFPVNTKRMADDMKAIDTSGIIIPFVSVAFSLGTRSGECK